MHPHTILINTLDLDLDLSFYRTASEAHLLLQRKTNGPVISTCKHIFPD